MGAMPFAGFKVGILCLETSHELLPGNVQHAQTFGFPVLYEPIPVQDPWQLMNGSESLAPAIVAAARRLESRGVPVVAGACGSFAYYQREVAAALDVPVFLSILMQIPLLLGSLGPHRKIGVICASATSINPRIFEACGIADPDRLVIRQMHGLPQFDLMLKAEPFDAARLQDETVAVARDIAADPAVAAILLQCSDLPPFAAAVQRSVRLPVFDMASLIRWLGNAVQPQSYCDHT